MTHFVARFPVKVWLPSRLCSHGDRTPLVCAKEPVSGNPTLLVVPRTVLIPLFVSLCNMPCFRFLFRKHERTTGGIRAGLVGWQTGSDKKQMMGSLWPHITDKEVHFGASLQEFLFTFFSDGVGCSPIMPVVLLGQPGVFLRLFPCCPPPPPRSSTSTCPVTTALGCVFLNCHRLQLARPSS